MEDTCTNPSLYIGSGGYSLYDVSCSVTNISRDPDESTFYRFRCMRRGKVLFPKEGNIQDLTELPMFHHGSWYIHKGRLVIERGGESFTLKRCN